MTFSDIISTKNSKSPGKSGSGLRSGNKVSQNTLKNSPEYDLDTFCDIISHSTSKYRPDFFGTFEMTSRFGLLKIKLIKLEFQIIKLEFRIISNQQF